jgi:hypothetical protein
MNKQFTVAMLPTQDGAPEIMVVVATTPEGTYYPENLFCTRAAAEAAADLWNAGGAFQHDASDE